MAPLSGSLLSGLKQAVDLLPEQVLPFRQQTKYHHHKRSPERKLFKILTAKLAGSEKEDQVAFLMNQARNLSRETYVSAALDSVTIPPNYASIEKKNRPTYRHVHKLIDAVLPIAAGSSSIISQKKIFEARWEFLHKQPYIPSKISFKTLQQSIKDLSSTLDLWKVVEQAISLLPDKPEQIENRPKNES